ncbi:MAG: radical SAM protein [Nitrospiraceae bacterium]|nr:radical SAM protein [Nitrospiraceae bacterium]
MKCALVIPSWAPEDIFSSKTAASQINYWQPLGTLYVASVLREAGHDVRFLNGAFRSHQSILDELAEFRPSLVGIYSTTFGWDKAKKAAADIRALMGDSAFLCAGGPYPSAVKELCMRDAGTLFDAAVCGEGEYTLRELLERLGAKRGLEGLQGLIYRHDDGSIVTNPERPLIQDLDALPFPARDLLGDAGMYIPPPATYRRRPVAVMITARGCNRRCIYCFQLDKDRRSGIRFRSIDSVIAEIEHCLSQGYREIKFIDDTLAGDYDRAMQLAREIKARGLDFTWFASACVNQVDKPLLQAFREAGCWAILFGAESGVQKNLNTIRKGTTLDQIRKAVKAAQEVGLKVSTPFMFGIPGETFEEGLETIRFAVELNPDIANFHAITPFPGTYLYDNLERFGTVSAELTDYTYQGAAFIPYSMTRDEIVRLRQIAFRSFYGRPSFLLKRLLELRSLNDLRVAARSARSLFWLFARDNLFTRMRNQPGA